MSEKKRTLLDDWKAIGNNLTGKQKVIIALVLVIIVMLLVERHDNRSTDRTPSRPPSSSTSPSQTPPRTTELNASVRFSGTQFIITNEDSFNWSSVKMEVNGGIISGGYELTVPTMKAKETYTVGAMQFADSDGKRFNPFQMKPQKFTIRASTPDGYRYYVGGWN
jgi:hypothetical protein